MCYSCSICGRHCPPRQPRRLHIVYRPNGSILREVPVCQGCHEQLESGTRFDILVGMHLRRRQREAGMEVPTMPMVQPMNLNNL